MIVADLDHIERQSAMTPELRAAIAFLRRLETKDLPDGRVEVDGTRVFAIVQRYETAKTDSLKFEYHQRYIDIQFIVSGEEIIGWVPQDRMRVVEPYDEDKDICFGSVADADWTPVLLRTGQAAILHPEDAHAPRLAAAAPAQVMKIVVKVAVQK